MAKEVVWSDLAKLELSNILDYYVQQNGNANYSLKSMDQIDECFYNIKK